MEPTSLTGDGLALAGNLGADVRRIQNSLFLMLGYTLPSPIPGQPPTSYRASIVELFCPHTMVVNRDGKRFADESFFQGIVPKLREFDALGHEFKNLPCYLIFDSQYLEKFSFANQPLGTAVASGVPRADSLEDLAIQLGIDGAELAKTVNRFNAFARDGTDEDFHRGELKWKLASPTGPTGKNPALGTIERAPFYGVKLLPSIANSAGIVADRDGRVTRRGGQPIKGLYASGVVALRDEGGAGYQAGLTLAAAMTFSFLGVRHMLTE